MEDSLELIIDNEKGTNSIRKLNKKLDVLNSGELILLEPLQTEILKPRIYLTHDDSHLLYKSVLRKKERIRKIDNESIHHFPTENIGKLYHYHLPKEIKENYE